jgi:hypothetical protein
MPILPAGRVSRTSPRLTPAGLTARDKTFRGESIRGILPGARALSCLTCLGLLCALVLGCDSRGTLPTSSTGLPLPPPPPPQAATLTQLGFRPDSLQLTIGTGALLQVVGTMSDGSTQSVTGVTLTSDNPAILTVDNAGVVTPIAPGRASVVATKGSVSARAPVSVQPQSRAHVDIKPDLLCVRAGYGYQFIMHRYDAAGVEIAPGPVQWASANTAIATIDTTGKLTTSSVGGHVSISGTAGGFTDTTPVIVDPAPLGQTMTCQ